MAPGIEASAKASAAVLASAQPVLGFVDVAAGRSILNTCNMRIAYHKFGYCPVNDGGSACIKM